ncbi:MAG: hypothetical protein IJB86_08405 [Clostridia bacterium]|nr:hypothetical protein [Clostridia bacterium]
MLFSKERPYLISLKSKDPEYNLAAEEYLFSQRRENFILLWRNSPCVIIGKNQIGSEEVSGEYLSRIPVLKRSTGGGAVYHDENNLNFSFIKNDCTVPSLLEYTEPIRSFLNSLSIETELSDTNDILLHGKKISGTASRTKNGRVLFHGTLLFRCDADTVNRVLTPTKTAYTKGVRSVKSRVGEICPYTDIKTAEEFELLLQNYLLRAENARILNINCINL